MFRQSIKSITIVFNFAPLETSVKLLQLLLNAVLTPLSIFFTGRLIDAIALFVKGQAGYTLLVFWGGLLLVSMFFGVSSSTFDGILGIIIKRKLNSGLTPLIVDKFKSIEYSCFEDPATHDTINRMTNDPHDNLFQLFLNITGVFTIFISLMGSAIVFAQVGLWFMLGFLALLLPMVLCDFKAADMMNTMFNNQSPDERKLHYLGSLLSNKASIFELKIFGAAQYILSKWRGIAAVVLDERVRTTIRSQKYFMISTILFKLWSFFVVLSLVYSIIYGRITIGLFTALIASTGAVMDNANLLSHSVQRLRERFLLIKHYNNFLSLPEVSQCSNTSKIDKPKIVFENVSFTYPGTEKLILNNTSFEINPGEKIALVGENGAGKSTIIKLLCRLYKPQNGRILINGFDIQTLSQTQLSKAYSVVFQDFFSYHLTLRENIAFGNIAKLKDDVALHRAMKQGMADSLNLELHTNLGKLEESGVDLSGGQWQRVAIARGCAADSAFVILDEPTAALDPIAESEMYHSFSSVLENRGCIMISHRLASARLADRIIVIAHGCVSESGSHEELLNLHGLYQKMWLAQSSWYKEGGIE